MDGGLEYRGSARVASSPGPDFWAGPGDEASARGAVSVKYRTLVCILIIIYLKRTWHVFLQEGVGAVVILLEASEGQCQVHLGQLW